MKVLVTGGLGFIGSHTCVELLEKGYDVVIIDNLYNSNIEVKDRIEEITGKKVKLYTDDLLGVMKQLQEKQVKLYAAHLKGNNLELNLQNDLLPVVGLTNESNSFMNQLKKVSIFSEDEE